MPFVTNTSVIEKDYDDDDDDNGDCDGNDDCDDNHNIDDNDDDDDYDRATTMMKTILAMTTMSTIHSILLM